jgi:hypothetical protein
MSETGGISCENKHTTDDQAMSAVISHNKILFIEMTDL